MTTKVTVSLPDEFLAEVDRVARAEQRSRSELVRQAVCHYLALRRRQRKPGHVPQVQQAVARQDALARFSPGTGEDSAADIRLWRSVHFLGNLGEGGP
jgi:Arc/MetJ-type ribon-helix-helix transcriptional regulator